LRHCQHPFGHRPLLDVTVAEGPFAGLEATYQNTDAESHPMILLNILSKPVAMRIDTASLRKTG
jgi:transcription antitermination factor NusG